MPGPEAQRRSQGEKEKKARQARMLAIVDEVYTMADRSRAEILGREYARLLFERTLEESTRLFGIRHFPRALEQDARQEITILVWKKFVREPLAEQSQFEWEIFTDAGRIFQTLIAQYSTIPMSRGSMIELSKYHQARANGNFVETLPPRRIIRYASLEEADTLPAEDEGDVEGSGSVSYLISQVPIWFAEFWKEESAAEVEKIQAGTRTENRFTEVMKIALSELFLDPDGTPGKYAKKHSLDTEAVKRMRMSFSSWVFRTKKPFVGWSLGGRKKK